MTLTRWTIDDLGGTLPWGRLSHFLCHLPPSSALRRELDGEASAWVNGYSVAGMLADIFDLLNMLRHDYQVSHTPKNKTRPPRPEPARRPRPHTEDERKEPFDYEALRAKLHGGERGGNG